MCLKTEHCMNFHKAVQTLSQQHIQRVAGPGRDIGSDLTTRAGHRVLPRATSAGQARAHAMPQSTAGSVPCCSTKSFFVHHAERLAAACAIGEAAGIKAIKNRKQSSSDRCIRQRLRLRVGGTTSSTTCNCHVTICHVINHLPCHRVAILFAVGDSRGG